MRRETPWLLWLAAGLLILLAGLAVLQYRWLGEVSAAERQRMEASLRARAEQFAEEFDRDIARAFFWLQVEPDAIENQEWARYAERYDRWVASSPRPRLVREIWLLTPDSAPRRFNPTARAFEPAPLTAALAPFWKEAEGELRDRSAHASIRWFHAIREDIPAIIIPVPQLVTMVPRKDLHIEQLNPLARRGFTAILLDGEYLRREMLPQLAERHFGPPDSAEYHVTVASRESKQQVFSYGPAVQGSGTPDTTLSLLDIRLDTLADLRVAARTGQAAGAPHERGAIPQTVIITTPDADKRPATSAPQIDRRFAMSIVQREQVKPGGALALPGARWELAIRHRAGSLEAAVSATRWRNFLISMGVLELLAVSVVLLVVSVRRASRLAAQQVKFVAAVSHELRTPLAVIRSAGENLADGVVAEPEQVKRYGELVRNEGLRLSSMVEQVLAFAGVQGSQALRLAPEHLRDVIDRAVAGASADLHDAGLTLDIDVPADLSPVSIDGEAVARALSNLLTNAAKYAADGGRVRIAAAIVASGREVQITVEDRGPGIDAADLPHVFEPFFRAPAVVASRVRGSGLGLSLVHAIARAHGGRVSVRSEPGQGSTFTLHLPLVTPRPDASAREPVPASRS